MSPATKTKSSQEFIPIKAIRENVVILEDGSLRMILMASSLNFSLKSSDEQEAIIMQFQDFLNSLDFSVQFFIQSRHLDIEPYLDSLKDAEKKQLNELLKIQIKEYIEFVKNFVSMSEIVSKTFYISIPFTPALLEVSGTAGVKGLFDALGKLLGTKKTGTEAGENKFGEYKSQLQQRSDVVSQGLARSGIRTAPLDTEELIELFYKLYNPTELAKGQIPTAALRK